MSQVFHMLLRQVYSVILQFPLPASVSRSHVPSVVSSLCNRYQKPECDSAARSRVSDTEDPFQGRDLTGLIHFLVSDCRNILGFNLKSFTKPYFFLQQMWGVKKFNSTP